MRKVVLAAHDHVERMVKRADGSEGGGPRWFGWALREAFICGAAWNCTTDALRQNPPAKLVKKEFTSNNRAVVPCCSYCGESDHVTVGAYCHRCEAVVDTQHQ